MGLRLDNDEVYFTKRANFYAALQNKAFTYLYRRMFENDGEDRIERMRSTGVIILEGMTIEWQLNQRGNHPAF